MKRRKGLKGHVVVVTGASSGIGRAICLALAEKGATLCLVGRDVKRLKEVAGQAHARAGRVGVYALDLTVDDKIEKFGRHLEREVGGIDILIHSAGDFSMGAIENAPVKDFDRQYRVNVRGPYLLTQVLLPLIRSRKGQVVFINSSAGLKSRAQVGQYAATKHALKAIADSLREEVNAEGIRVLSVFPGRTATPMQEAVHRMEGREYQPDRFMHPEDVASVIVHALSLHKRAEVTEISIRPMKQ